MKLLRIVELHIFVREVINYYNYVIVTMIISTSEY